MKNNKIRIATVFSGIGAIEQALLKMKLPYEIVFACDNGEREIEQSYEEIIEYSNLVIAFWDGKSKGTDFVIKECKKIGREVKIVLM